MKQVFMNAVRSVWRTVAGTFTFDGRARIVDVVCYWLASMVAGALIGLLAERLAWDAEWVADRTTAIVLGLPMIALFARRLQDQGISGWWTLVVLPLPAINLYQSYRAVFAVQNPGWLNEANPLDPWIPWLFVIVLGLMVMLLRPGTRGANRYGPDPREAASA